MQSEELTAIIPLCKAEQPVLTIGGFWRSGRCPWQANQRYDSHETRRMCNPTHRVVARGISSTLN